MAAAPRRARLGYTYLGLMFIVALLAMVAAMASVVWSMLQRRENERQLLFAGTQIAAAIERRHRQPVGGGFPRKLEDLLGDAQHRELRQVYVDPMTGSREWGLIQAPGGGIVGVHSLSDAVPILQTRFPGAKSYREWRFVAPSAGENDATADPPPGSASAPSSPFSPRPAARQPLARPPAG